MNHGFFRRLFVPSAMRGVLQLFAWEACKVARVHAKWTAKLRRTGPQGPVQKRLLNTLYSEPPLECEGLQRGEYLLVAGESANGSPLWKQMGGKYWLYSGDARMIRSVSCVSDSLQTQEQTAYGSLEGVEPKGKTSTVPEESFTRPSLRLLAPTFRLIHCHSAWARDIAECIVRTVQANASWRSIAAPGHGCDSLCCALPLCVRFTLPGGVVHRAPRLVRQVSGVWLRLQGQEQEPNGHKLSQPPTSSMNPLPHGATILVHRPSCPEVCGG